MIAYAVPHRPTLSQAELEEQLTPVLRRGEHPNQAALTASITPLVSSLVTLSEEDGAGAIPSRSSRIVRNSWSRSGGTLVCSGKWRMGGGERGAERTQTAGFETRLA